MKTKLTLFVTVLAVALFVAGCASTATENDAEIRNRAIYLKGDSTPFSGRFIGHDEQGNKTIEMALKDGLPRKGGPIILYYSNGEKMLEAKGSNALVWHKSGKKALEATSSFGSMQMTSWYESGQKKVSGLISGRGKRVRFEAWHENGVKKVEFSGAKSGSDKTKSVKMWGKEGKRIEVGKDKVNGIIESLQTDLMQGLEDKMKIVEARMQKIEDKLMNKKTK